MLTFDTGESLLKIGHGGIFICMSLVFVGLSFVSFGDGDG